MGMEFERERGRVQGCDFSGADDDGHEDANKHRRFDPAASATGPQAGNDAMGEREHMFDKVVTPSDVGKLNRLVIPKQHAERFFPIDSAAAHEKGLLLSFEDRSGKPWRFRYSYWNSSQSYVMTKGWSRFVKEKRLDAGDTVSFGRGVDDKDRLFIDWKRRPDIHDPPRVPRIPLTLPSGPNYHHHHPMLSFGRLLVPPQPAAAVYDGHHHHRQNYVYDAAGGSGGGGAQYLVFGSAVAPPQGSGFSFSVGAERDGTMVGAAAAPVVLESVPVVQRQAAAKRVRLFGVNLDLEPESNGDPEDSGSRSRTWAGFSSSPPPPSPKGKEKDQHPSLDLDM